MFSCDKVITIPQYYSTCWFNAILMAILYSQYSRKLLLHTFEKKDDKFSRIMNDIIKHNYIKSNRAIEYFKFMRPENILKYMNIDRVTKDKLKEYIKIGHFADIFLPYFIKSLNKNVLEIFMIDNNPNMCFANFYSIVPLSVEDFYKDGDKKTIPNYDLSKWDKIPKNPDYILVNPCVFDTQATPYSHLSLRIIAKDVNVIQKTSLTSYNITINGLSTLDDNIFYNGNKYVLDSVILGNYNNVEINLGHAIAGITCKKDKYVYNGWMRSTNDPSNIDKENTNNTLPCELMKFNWNVKEDTKFCLNPSLCKLTNIIDEKKLCFSFNKLNNLTLIYVKDNSYKSIDSDLPISESITLPSLKSNSSNFSKLDFLNDKDKKKYIIERKERKKEQEKFKKIVKKEPKKKPEELLKEFIKKPKELLKEPKKKPEELLKEPKKKPKELLKEPKKKPKELLKEPKKKPKELLKQPKKKLKEPKKKPEELLKEFIKKPKEPKKKLKESKKKPEELFKEPKKKPKEINKNIKDCGEYKILNPKTNRCVKKDGRIGKNIL